MQNVLMMISKAHPPGELPPYVPPDNPSSPWEPGISPAPSRQKLASTQIRPNQIMLPFVPKEADTDDMYGEGVDEVELKGLQAHGEGRGPQQKFHNEYNEPLDKPPWRHANPRGEPIDIEWQKKEYMEQHPQFFSKNKGMTISGQPEFDQFMQNMRRGGQNPKSGSIKHHPPHIQKLILGIGKRIRV